MFVSRSGVVKAEDDNTVSGEFSAEVYFGGGLRYFDCVL